MSKMGIALGLQAAHICHYPNFIDDKYIKTQITFIDEAADNELKSLKYRLRGLFEEVDYSYICFKEKRKNYNSKNRETFTDIELKFIKAHFEDEEVQDFLINAANEKNSYLTVAVALPDSSVSLAAALNLPDEIFYRNANVLVWQEHSHAIVSMLSNKIADNKYRKYENMRPFGMIDNCYEFTIEDRFLPMMIKHTYDRVYNEENQNKKLTEWNFHDEKILEEAWNNWKKDDNVSALKASNRYSANSVRIKERSLDIEKGKALDKNQIHYAARMEHNRWIMEKLLIGFRAQQKNKNKKMSRQELKERFIHPDIVPYEKLEKDEKNQDVRLHDANICNAIPYMLEAIEILEEKKKQYSEKE